MKWNNISDNFILIIFHWNVWLLFCVCWLMLLQSYHHFAQNTSHLSFSRCHCSGIAMFLEIFCWLSSLTNCNKIVITTYMYWCVILVLANWWLRIKYEFLTYYLSLASYLWIHWGMEYKIGLCMDLIWKTAHCVVE